MTLSAPTSPVLRPRRPAGVVLHPPAAEGQRWVVEIPERGYARLGADAVRLLRAADGRRDAAGLARSLGEPWTVEAVDHALGDLAALGLVVDNATGDRDEPTDIPTDVAEPAVPPPARRVTVKAPCTVQVDVVRPAAWFARHEQTCRRLTGRPAAGAMLLLGVAGLVALAARATHVTTALSTPQPPAAVLAVIVGFVLLTSVHELAHAAALAGQGGRVRRMGVMLLYLTPAFFTDVTDGWRLPDPAARVRVALAGGVASVGLAGGLGLVVAFAGVDAGPVPAYLAVTTYAGAVLNLVPLVPFDGYLALMSHLDRPHLRDRARHDGRLVVARAVAGPAAVPAVRALPDLPWAPGYGLACSAMPVALVGGTILALSGALAGLGPVGAALRLGLSLVLVALAGLAVRRVAALANRRALRPARLVGGLLAAGLGLAAVGAVPLADTVLGGYVRDDDGRVRLVLAAAGDGDRLLPGMTVQLRQRGLLLSRPVGRATVAADPPRSGPVPAAALTAGLVTPGTRPAVTAALDGVDLGAAEPAVGETEIGLGTTTVAGWLRRELLTEPLRDLGSSRP